MEVVVDTSQNDKLREENEQLHQALSQISAENAQLSQMLSQGDSGAGSKSKFGDLFRWLKSRSGIEREVTWFDCD